MVRKRKRVRRRQPEAELQKLCVAWARARFPGAILAYIDNNATSARAGYRKKLLGTLPGMPDLFLYHRNASYSGLGIEMKQPGRKATAAQAELHDKLTAEGFLIVVISSLESFQSIVTSYIEKK